MALPNLTSSLMYKHSHVQIEEWTKQGGAVQFNSGKSQRIVSSTLPAIEMTISYKSVPKSIFDNINNAYQDHHAQTFELDTTNEEDLSLIDPRRNHLDDDNVSVWAFKEFKFSVKADLKYTGTIKLITSVFFNFTEYQDQYDQSYYSQYSPTISTDTTFTTLLTNTATPYQVDYEYVNNSIFSNIGQSARHIKDKDGLRKKWTLSWLLNQSDFLSLLKYYRQRGGIMSEFGMPAEGSTGIGSGDVTKAIFMTDSFKYDKRVDGLYTCKADIVEVIK
jgi:hypothetical protein